MEAPRLMTDSIWISRRNELHNTNSVLPEVRQYPLGPNTDEACIEAIICIDLEGSITSWSLGAQRLFGYEPHEVIGRSDTILVPADSLSQAPTVLDHILKGDRLGYFQTPLLKKDAVTFQASVTVVPVKDSRGNIVGVSKIVRNVTDRMHPKERWERLLEETHDRLRDVVTLSSGRFFLKDPLRLRLRDCSAEQRSQMSLTRRFAELRGQGDVARSLTLHDLIRQVTARYDAKDKRGVAVVSTTGADLPVSNAAVVDLGRVLGEFAEESARSGALSAQSGRVDIVCLEEDDEISLIWTEHGGPAVDQPGDQDGLKDFLVRRTVSGRLRGTIVRAWRPEGIAIRVSAPRSRLAEN
jgi:PAS domain S-box-containing protein